MYIGAGVYLHVHVYTPPSCDQVTKCDAASLKIRAVIMLRLTGIQPFRISADMLIESWGWPKLSNRESVTIRDCAQRNRKARQQPTNGIPVVA